MPEQITLLKALRQKKTLAQQIATANERARRFAVVEEGSTVDFKPEEQLEVFKDTQRDLRTLKLACVQKSLGISVKIPDTAPVAESGQEVPAYLAVLIRDDLKSFNALLSALIDMQETQERDPWGDDNRKLPARKRQYNFQQALDLSKQVQDAIDSIDSAIQFIDSTTKV